MSWGQPNTYVMWNEPQEKHPGRDATEHEASCVPNGRSADGKQGRGGLEGRRCGDAERGDYPGAVQTVWNPPREEGSDSGSESGEGQTDGHRH